MFVNLPAGRQACLPAGRDGFFYTIDSVLKISLPYIWLLEH